METIPLLPIAKGFIRSFDRQYAMADVYITASLLAGFPDLPGIASYDPLILATTYSNADGSFEMQLDMASPLAAYACYLEHCHSSGIELRCYDTDHSLLMELPAMQLSDLQNITLQLHQTDWVPISEDWQSVGALLQQGQIMTLDRLAEEITSLAPEGIFKGWSILKRLGLLYGLENAALDPNGLLMQAGIPVRMAQLQNLKTRNELRQQIANFGLQDLLQVFDNAVIRLDLLGGNLLVTDLLLNYEGFEQGDIRSGVSHFLGKEGLAKANRNNMRQNIFARFPWMKSPLSSYRDYLVEIWAKRATKQVHGQLLDTDGALLQLNNRFHQDFTTTHTAEKPANQLANAILLNILQAQVGSGFGFGVAAAAIKPQGEISRREYLDYLISLSGESLQELENRYRINLSRSDLEMSSPVQQNIETLQRFFTDSFQCTFDPYPILPPLTGNGLSIINEYTYPNHSNGPFFWQYEEWLERNEPFYAENYYDIRKTFKIYVENEESQKAIWGRTVSLQQFLALRLDYGGYAKFTPPNIDSPSTYITASNIADQWGRNMIELQDWLNDAHKDFFAGFYTQAEQKYLELLRQIDKLNILCGRWKGTIWDVYRPSDTAAEQLAMKINDPDALEGFEKKYHLSVGGRLDDQYAPPWYSISAMKKIAYLIDTLLNRLLPTCLTEARLSLGKYRECIQGGSKPYTSVGTYPKYEPSLAGIAQFDVYTGPTSAEPGAKKNPQDEVWWPPLNVFNTGSLPYATNTALATQEKMISNSIYFPAHAFEKAYFRLKLGDALLEWADLFYRTDQPQNLNRAREIYKGVLFLHGQDPEIEPDWGVREWWEFKPFGVGKITQNPLLTTQINRAYIGFQQLNAGLNFYGFPKDYVPPVRYRVLRDAALSFSASAKSTQTDYLNYMAKYEQAILDEMTARSMLEKASYAIQIADEQVQITQFSAGEAQKQVEGVKAQIAAKQKEIKDSESFFSQLGDFFSGMKDSAKGLGESVLGSMSGEGEAVGGSVDWGSMYKVMSSKGSTSAATAGLTGGMAVAAGYGAFIYAGVTSMQSLEAAGNKRQGELKALQEVALPAAEKMVQLKQREVKIAGLQRQIAQAEYAFGQKLLAFYDYRFLSKAFWQQMSGFANRLMRRYLDLGGRTAWFAERALSFETDKDVRVISFDYFPKYLRGVTGADKLQLHLAEMEATRIYGLSQTMPVKLTISLARDFSIAFGQLKKHGTCHFATSEATLRLAYPGVFGYRVRCVSIGATYADDAFPHKGMLNNNGFSMVTRSDGSSHRLLRYPDALPLSEFNMRGDMWVYDLPDETLLPFEGSGIETPWQLSLSRFGDATSLENLTDVLLTFDMRANYSATLDAVHKAAQPAMFKKSVLISGRAQNPGEVNRFKKDGGVLKLIFRPVLAANNSIEKMRKITFLALMLSGVEQSPVSATLSADTDSLTTNFNLKNGVAFSNAGFLAAANGGIPLPLNILTGNAFDQSFTLTIDAAANAGVDFLKMYDVQLVVEYEGQI